MSGLQDTRVEESLDFDGLTIRFDDRVLRPRPWTAAQSRWAADLLEALPAGPVLEVCAGAGHIGLGAVARSRRHLVSVDVDPVAIGYATLNANAAGMADRVEIRRGRLEDALTAGEEFVLIIADPPWVRRTEISRFPEDPVVAIDGGTDGLDVARLCLHVIGTRLAARGVALLQLGTPEQAEALAPEIDAAGLRVVEVRAYDGGVVVCLARSGSQEREPEPARIRRASRSDP